MLKDITSNRTKQLITNTR